MQDRSTHEERVDRANTKDSARAAGAVLGSLAVHSEKLLESILESLGSGVIVTDHDGKFLLFNSAAEKILGLGASDAKPEDWARTYGLYQADKRTLLTEDQNPLVRAMRGESVDKVEVFVRNKNIPLGAWCSINGRPLREGTDTDESASRGGVIVVEDVTVTKKLSDELSRSNKDLQQFAYVAAHDLQEPIRTIIGFGDLLHARLESAMDEKSKDQFGRIINAARRMQSLITALLLFARVETRAKAPELCDCNAALAEVLHDMHSVISSTGATIQSDKLPTIIAEPYQIRQVFQNLLSNALKYKGSKDPVVLVKTRFDGTFHHFSLTDNGMGMEMKYSERIFLIFQRLHSKNQYEGAGVGLSLCKRIIERHGGEIWVDSKPGEGSTFFFTLPAYNIEE